VTVSSDRPTLVVIGVGGIGLAVARRLGAGRRIVLADHSADQLERATLALQAEGLAVDGHRVDVTSVSEVGGLAASAGSVGPLGAVVHTAGVSPVQASSADIFGIDLLGAALVIEAFEPYVMSGTALTVIASMAGQLASLDAAAEEEIATVPAAELLALPRLDPAAVDSATAYMVAKRGAQLRVRAAARAYGSRGGRINSVSPGIVHTPMGMAELSSSYGDMMRALLDDAPAGRIAAAADIAAAVAFLSSPDASYITGTDLLVDGGVIAGL
jgi:NAD(P)-dependent dehydrogenase (short-subunit alcohol dehydrogenase family)